MSTLVSGGRAASVITSQLSNPTTATSAGTERPISRKRVERAARDLVVAAEERVWREPPAGEEALNGLPPPHFRPMAGKAIAVARLEAGFGERGAIALLAQPHGLEALRAGDMSNPLAAERGEMADRKRRAPLVVRQEAQCVRILDPRKDVDHRQPASRGLDRLALVGAARGDDEAIDALAKQLIDVPALPHRVVGRIAHEDRDAVVGESPLQSRDDRKGEAAEAVVGENADRHRARAVQALREAVRPVADVLGDREEPWRAFPR